MDYKEEDYLQLAGIQHFVFCSRQWALIHIEQQWAENFRTVDGKILHEHAHDREFSERRGNILTIRGLPVHSVSMGVSGECDVVEYRRDDQNGVPLVGQEGKYLVFPVEYKHGKPKENDADALQLAAQAMCLEEMLCCSIPVGYLYYGETRHRQEVAIDDGLRRRVRQLFEEMHRYYDRRYTPTVKRTKSCNACSLKNLCLPALGKKATVKNYIDARLNEDVGKEDGLP